MKNEKEIKNLEKAVEVINKRIDKLKEGKPELEVDRWYRNGNLLFYVTQIHDKQTYGYGFDHGEWDKIEDTMSGGWTFELDKSNTPATNEEVEAALIAEAKKRGFKEGNYECLVEPKYTEYTTEHGYFMEDNLLWFGRKASADCVFMDGKWAEIIKEPKVVINGYEMKQEGNTVSFGCADLNSIELGNVFTRLYNFNKYAFNRKIKSITLDSGVEITVKQLGEIVDNIK